jgi:hypothetical protein
MIDRAANSGQYPGVPRKFQFYPASFSWLHRSPR